MVEVIDSSEDFDGDIFFERLLDFLPFEEFRKNTEHALVVRLFRILDDQGKVVFEGINQHRLREVVEKVRFVVFILRTGQTRIDLAFLNWQINIDTLFTLRLL